MSEKLITTRNRVVAKQSRCEGVYNRTGDLSVTCFGKEEQRNECEAIKKSPQAICSLRRRGWGGRIRQGKPCRLQQFICPFCFAKDGLIGSNPAEQSKQKNNRHSFVSVIFWLGWQDSNLRMQQSKCCVLPLDDTPILSLLSILIFQNILIL